MATRSQENSRLEGRKLLCFSMLLAWLAIVGGVATWALWPSSPRLRPPPLATAPRHVAEATGVMPSPADPERDLSPDLIEEESRPAGRPRISSPRIEAVRVPDVVLDEADGDSSGASEADTQLDGEPDWSLFDNKQRFTEGLDDLLTRRQVWHSTGIPVLDALADEDPDRPTESDLAALFLEEALELEDEGLVRLALGLAREAVYWDPLIEGGELAIERLRPLLPLPYGIEPRRVRDLQAWGEPAPRGRSYKRAIKLGKRVLETCRLRAMQLEVEGDQVGALRLWAEIQALDPGNDQALSRLDRVRQPWRKQGAGSGHWLPRELEQEMRELLLQELPPTTLLQELQASGVLDEGYTSRRTQRLELCLERFLASGRAEELLQLIGERAILASSWLLALDVRNDVLDPPLRLVVSISPLGLDGVVRSPTPSGRHGERSVADWPASSDRLMDSTGDQIPALTGVSRDTDRRFALALTRDLLARLADGRLPAWLQIAGPPVVCWMVTGSRGLKSWMGSPSVGRQKMVAMRVLRGVVPLESLLDRQVDDPFTADEVVRLTSLIDLLQIRFPSSIARFARARATGPDVQSGNLVSFEDAFGRTPAEWDGFWQWLMLARPKR